MALHLKRITRFNECEKCSITKELIAYGDYYYQDDMDGVIVSYNYYHDMKLNIKRQEAMPALQEALSGLSYKQMLHEKERQFLAQTIFDRPLYTGLEPLHDDSCPGGIPHE